MHSQTTQRTIELITLEDFAGLLQVSKRQLYLMESDGRLGPARVQIGRAVRFRRREVEAWIEAACPTREEWLALQQNDCQSTYCARDNETSKENK